MAVVNKPLQRRAGRNIGIEPGFCTFMQDAGCPEIDVNTNIGAETVILECPAGMARSPQRLGTVVGDNPNNNPNGFIVNRTADPVAYTVLFQDDQGNKLEIAGGQTADPNDVSSFTYGLKGEKGGLGLAIALNPGEKILLRIASVFE